MARYTIVFRDDIEKMLHDLVEEEKTTKAELIKRSLFFYLGIKEELMEVPGQKIAVVDNNNKVMTHIVNPYWILQPQRGECNPEIMHEGATLMVS